MNIDLEKALAGAPIAMRVLDGQGVIKCYIHASKHSGRYIVEPMPTGIFTLDHDALMENMVGLWTVPEFKHWNLLDDSVTSIRCNGAGMWFARTDSGDKDRQLLLHPDMFPSLEPHDKFIIIHRPKDD